MKKLTIVDQSTDNTFSLYDNYLGTILRKFEGFEYSSVKASIDDVSGRYGASYVNSKFGTRRLSIEGDIVSEDVYTLRRALVNVLRQTGTLKLIKFTTYDDLELQCEAEIVKFTEPYTHAIHTFLIEMIAPDWRFYSQTLKSESITRTDLMGGASVPMSVPISFPLSPATLTSLGRVISNDGNDDSDPIFTINGAGSGFIVSNNTTGKQFTLDRTLTDSDSVVIDVRNRTVVLNGVTNVYSSFDGDFWSMIPSTNDISFSINSGHDASTSLTVEFRDAYIGI